MPKSKMSKGNELGKLIKTVGTPKGFAVIATIVLAAAVGGVAISSFAAPSCKIESTKAVCKAKQSFTKSFSKKYKFTFRKTDSVKTGKYSFSIDGKSSGIIITGQTSSGQLGCGKKIIFNDKQANFNVGWPSTC